MIIGVDLDEVSGHYVNALRDAVAKPQGLTAEEALLKYPAPSDYNFSNWPEVPEEFVKYHSEAVALGLYKDMKVIEGASETLWKLNNDGHHLRVITARFVKHGQNYRVVANTAEWLDRNDIPYRDLMFVRDKVDVYADVYIDDSPSNIKAFHDAGRKVIIFETSYNKDIAGLRARNWDEVYEIIQMLQLEEDGE